MIENIQIFFHEIDLFDFTSFFGLEFFKFSGPATYDIFIKNIDFLFGGDLYIVPDFVMKQFPRLVSWFPNLFVWVPRSFQALYQPYGKKGKFVDSSQDFLILILYHLDDPMADDVVGGDSVKKLHK